MYKSSYIDLKRQLLRVFRLFFTEKSYYKQNFFVMTLVNRYKLQSAERKPLTA